MAVGNHSTSLSFRRCSARGTVSLAVTALRDLPATEDYCFSFSFTTTTTATATTTTTTPTTSSAATATATTTTTTAATAAATATATADWVYSTAGTTRNPME